MGTLGYQILLICSIFILNSPLYPFRYSSNTKNNKHTWRCHCLWNKSSYKTKCQYSIWIRWQTIQAIPIHIELDFLTGRQYLNAVIKRSAGAKYFRQPQTYRLDIIKNIRLQDIDDILYERTLLQLKPQPKPVQLRITYTSSLDKNRLAYRILTRYPQAKLEQEDEHHFTCTLLLHDTLRILPWIKTLYPHVEIVNTPYLQRRLIKDVKEALANYDQYTTISWNTIRAISYINKFGQQDLWRPAPIPSWYYSTLSPHRLGKYGKINQLIDSIFIFNQQGFAELLLNAPIKNSPQMLTWLG